MFLNRLKPFSKPAQIEFYLTQFCRHSAFDKTHKTTARIHHSRPVNRKTEGNRHKDSTATPSQFFLTLILSPKSPPKSGKILTDQTVNMRL